jgi:hypothetical protein
VVVFVKEPKTAKALCTSLGQHRRLYKAMKKGFVKKYDAYSAQAGFCQLSFHDLLAMLYLKAGSSKP